MLILSVIIPFLLRKKLVFLSISNIKSQFINKIRYGFVYNCLVEQDIQVLKDRAKLLLDRLGRLSADSTWAHRASGLRGSLIRAMENNNPSWKDRDITHFSKLIEQGFRILYLAAKEIPDQENPTEK